MTWDDDEDDGRDDFPIITVRLLGSGVEFSATLSGPRRPPRRTTDEYRATALRVGDSLGRQLAAFVPTANVRRARLSWRVPGGRWHYERQWRPARVPGGRGARPGLGARPGKVPPAAAAAGYRRRW